FVVGEDEETRVSREEIDGLLLRKESLLRENRELDDDYESAKVAPEMYMAARPQMVRQPAPTPPATPEPSAASPPIPPGAPPSGSKTAPGPSPNSLWN
ncbi:MAG TPA: hypothetical protein PLF84_19005, partial [Bryobacteraceae bacterium]|nr:hypothetical protein [Bryobacteraceae bacterium]